MEKMINRQYHETIGNIIPIELPKDIILGNSLLDKIPKKNNLPNEGRIYNGEDNKNKSIPLTQTDIIKLLPKLNFNLPQEKECKMMEKIFISNRDYWNLYHLLRSQSPFDKLSKFVLYRYCRTLVNKPITNAEYIRITNDLKAIKRYSRDIEKNLFKIRNGKYNLYF